MSCATTGRNGEPLPFAAVHEAGEQHDLSHVICRVGERPLDRLRHRVLFATNGHGFCEILGRERFNALPARLPAFVEEGHERRSVLGPILEFTIAVASGLLAVGRQKVGPAAQQIAAQVPQDHGDAVDALGGTAGKFLIGKLLQCPVQETSVTVEGFQDGS